MSAPQQRPKGRELEHFPNLVAMFFSRAAQKGDAPFLWAKIEGPKEPPPMAERAEDLLAVEDADLDKIDGNVQK